jgi:lysophospholipase L1-like esterase
MKIRSEHLLLVGSVATALIVALALIRWLAPQLLGIPADLRLVSVAKELPPFYDGVFRSGAPAQDPFMLPDPVFRVRTQPFLPDAVGVGPHDVLGFRNFSVPATADIVIVGDSQTYGNNARLEDNWPSQMASRLRAKRPLVYSMAAGGWGAVQYLEMASYALRFRPRALVVAFYSGNDPAESVTMVHGGERWKSLRAQPPGSPLDLPAARFPPPPDDIWRMPLGGAKQIAFTPKLRLVSNDSSYPAVRAGWEIMAEAVRRISKTASASNVALLVTIIPTKELVYSGRATRSGVSPPPAYLQLVRAETANIAAFERAVKAAGARYVDIVRPMQNAALDDLLLYPLEENGHPVGDGYRVIAEEMARAVDALLPASPRGIVAVRYTENEYGLFLVTDEGAWSATPEMLNKNGWPAAQSIPWLNERDLATIPMRGHLVSIDRKRFGPEMR